MNRHSIGTALSICVLAALCAASCLEEDEPQQGRDDEVAHEPPELLPPGMSCRCDRECAPWGGCRSVCVFGVCMPRPCRPFGSDLEAPRCPDHTLEVEVHEYGGVVCYPECEAFDCEGDCDRSGLCRDTEDTDFWCDPRCSSYSSDDSI